MNHTKLRKALGLFNAKALAVLLSSALLVPLAAPLALAGPTEDAASKFYGQLSVSEIRTGGASNTATVVPAMGNTSTTTVVMTLSYSGTAATSNITIQAGGSSSGNIITFYAPEGTVDTSIGSATAGQTGGTFDLGASTVSTLGQLCDLINGVQGPYALNGNANGGAPTGGNYHCTLRDGIRSDSPSTFLPIVTEALNVNSLNAVGGYSVPIATNTIISLGIIPSTGRHVVLNFCAVNSAGTPSLQVYGSRIKYGVGATNVDQFGNAVTDATLAWSGAALTANTTTTEPLHNTSGIVPDYGPWIEFGGGGSYSYALNTPTGHAPVVPVGNAYNGHVVIRANNYAASNAPETTSNFLTCQWTEKSN